MEKRPCYKSCWGEKIINLLLSGILFGIGWAIGIAGIVNMVIKKSSNGWFARTELVMWTFTIIGIIVLWVI